MVKAKTTTMTVKEVESFCLLHLQRFSCKIIYFVLIALKDDVRVVQQDCGKNDCS
jgi:hypothetical protein